MMLKRVVRDEMMGKEAEVNVQRGHVMQACLGLVGMAKRWHIADRRGGGAQYSRLSAFYFPSFS